MGRDANDVLREGGPEAVAELYANAVTYVPKAKRGANGKSGAHTTKARPMSDAVHEKRAAKIVEKEAEKTEEPPHTPAVFRSVWEALKTPPKDRDWHLEHWMPGDDVTGLWSDGGI